MQHLSGKTLLLKIRRVQAYWLVLFLWWNPWLAVCNGRMIIHSAGFWENAPEEIERLSYYPLQEDNFAQMSHGCDNCMKEGEWKRCSGCQQAFYCSKKCQTSHWKKHKPNCFPPGSSIRQLFQACIDDLLPVPPTVGREYGFDNMRLYHGDVLWGESSPPFQLSAEQILLGVLRMIQTDVFLEEEVGARPCSSISPTMKMIVEAYENNS